MLLVACLANRLSSIRLCGETVVVYIAAVYIAVYVAGAEVRVTNERGE
jgi:hypothetical protein